jgi:hypothetical protein
MAHRELNAETNKGKRFEEIPQALAVYTRLFYPTKGIIRQAQGMSQGLGGRIIACGEEFYRNRVKNQPVLVILLTAKV